MTAEIAVMNRSAIALATDSAVTIGGGRKKIYTSVEKLFSLSNHAPVGLMIYGSANYLGVPWETIVKSYRNEAPEETFPHIEGYVEGFLRYVGRNRLLIPRSQDVFDREAMSMARSMYYGVLISIQKVLEAFARQFGGVSDDEVRQITQSVIDHQLQELRSKDFLPGFGPQTRKKISARYTNKILKLKREMFSKLPLSRATSRKLTSIGVEVLSREKFGNGRSGLVIAGYGNNEYMPVLISVNIEGMLFGKPRVSRFRKRSISSENSASVAPFAQDEMVCRFMEGIDPRLLEYVKNSVGGLLDRLINETKKVGDESHKGLGQKLEERIRGPLAEVFQSMIDGWGEFRQKNFWGPILDVVESMPKNELAAMAESLVNLTKVKRRVSPEEESVAGPIDVAIITKGDGFVWIKRKHYFSADLNPRKMAEYNRRG